MPPKIPPKTYTILLKTHKLTVFLTALPSASIASLKADALTALQSDVLDAPNPHTGMADADPFWTVPKVASVDDFELCKSVRDKGRPTGQYQLLDNSRSVRESIVNWEHVFVQFRDSSGKLLPVKVSVPTVDDEEEEIDPNRKGKRKASGP
ncbi:hypothetical protein A0H81_09717 [Grifola frondosa]|uniref:Uncharacterized protein n=1 Tax=Grifola frondosa TaxID=5627 RepID=A0A1C7M044_GRIFR|nr:hypothetical protein A0H81_09717 [Grifola frondosa]